MDLFWFVLAPILAALLGVLLAKSKKPGNEISKLQNDNRSLRERITELENQITNYKLKELQDRALKKKLETSP